MNEQDDGRDAALKVHTTAVMIDGHADTAQRFADEGWDFSGALGDGMLSLDTARRGGLSAEFFAIWAEPVQWKGRYAERTRVLIEAVLEQVRRHPAELRLCVSPGEILAAYAEGRFGVLLGIEGGHSIENDLDLLRGYYRLGVRYMTLTWANSNEWADSSGDLEDTTVEHHGGLTAFGCEVVREMNRLGMMVDVSHVSDATLGAVLEVARAPVIASHSSARALTGANRNLSDEWLVKIAAKGGLVMVNFFPCFIDEDWRRAWVALAPERHAAHDRLAADYRVRSMPMPFAQADAIDREFAGRIRRPPLASLIDHVDHMTRIAGIDHVGIGSDFDGIPALPEGIDSAADLPKITAALIRRGYSSEAVRKVLGGNLLRVFGAVQAAAE